VDFQGLLRIPFTRDEVENILAAWQKYPNEDNAVRLHGLDDPELLS